MRAPERSAPERSAPVAQRPERLSTAVDACDFAIASKPLSTAAKIANNTVLWKVGILIVLAAIWEIYGRWLNNQLLVPTFSATVKAFVLAIVIVWGVLWAMVFAALFVVGNVFGLRF